MNFRIIKVSILIFFVTVIITQAKAQSLSQGIGVGGFISTGSYIDSFKSKKTTMMRPGFKLYWLGRATIEGNIHFAPEIGYSMKGFRVKNPYPSNTVKEQEIILHYLEFKFIQEYSFQNKYFIKLGPSLSAAFAGRDKKLTTFRTNDPLAFNFAEWGRFEACINISAGVHVGGGWLAEVGLTKGISNIWDGDQGPNVKTMVFGASIAKYIRR